MNSHITIPEGWLIITVIAGEYTTGFGTPAFLARLKLHGTVKASKAGRTYTMERRRELRRLGNAESAADLVTEGVAVHADDNGRYHWRPAACTGFPDTAVTVYGQRAGTAWQRLEAVADRECDTFHHAHPGWEQYSLRLSHIRRYQRALTEVGYAQRSLSQAARAAAHIRDEYQITDAENLMEVPR